MNFLQYSGNFEHWNQANSRHLAEEKITIKNDERTRLNTKVLTFVSCQEAIIESL